MNRQQSARRPFGRSRACLALTRGLAMVPMWLAEAPGSDASRKRVARFHRLVAKGFGLKICVHGMPASPAGTLFVANHISWIDIPLLGSLIDAAFIAKADVGRWPGIGRLAARANTLFVERDRRSASNGQTRAIGAQLESGRGLILFPEGTTSDGDGVLPFRTSLFAAAAAARRVQPVAIVYRGPDGAPLTAGDQRRIAWLGDDALLPHAMQLARLNGITAHIWFETPLDPALSADRKALAAACQHAISVRVSGTVPAGGTDQAAVLNRSA